MSARPAHPAAAFRPERRWNLVGASRGCGTAVSVRLWDTRNPQDQSDSARQYTWDTLWARRSTTPAPAAPQTCSTCTGSNPQPTARITNSRSVRAGHRVGDLSGGALIWTRPRSTPPSPFSQCADWLTRCQPAGCQNTRQGAALLLRGRGWQGVHRDVGQGGTATVDASRSTSGGWTAVVPGTSDLA